MSTALSIAQVSTKSELESRLEELALSKSHPFCYGCYRTAPSGRCTLCGSDDLMRELEGVGCEYGTDWVIAALIRVNLIPVDTSLEFENSVSQMYPELTQVAWLEIDTVSVLKEMDPVSWRMALNEWIDSEISDEQMITFDHGSTYFWLNEIEEFLDKNAV